MRISPEFSEVVAFEALHRGMGISLPHHSSANKLHRCHFHRLMAIGTTEMCMKGTQRARVD